MIVVLKLESWNIRIWNIGTPSCLLMSILNCEFNEKNFLEKSRKLRLMNNSKFWTIQSFGKGGVPFCLNFESIWNFKFNGKKFWKNNWNWPSYEKF